MALEKHQSVLAYALANMKISLDTTPKYMIASLLPKPSSIISFSDSDLPLEGKSHNRRRVGTSLEEQPERTWAVVENDLFSK